MPQYWLLKTEPTTFSIHDLVKAPKQTTFWEGVRNYQARNMLRDDLKKGDWVLFYHSNTEPVGIFGTAKVVKEATPDPFQFDTQSKYYDPKATVEKPRWFGVEIKLDQVFKQPVTLKQLREIKGLETMKLLAKGQRLSVQPVSPKEWDIIMQQAQV